MGDFDLERIFKSFVKILAASVLMVPGSYYVIRFFPDNAILQASAAALIASLIYLIATVLLKSPEIELVLKKFFKNAKY